MDNNKLDIPKEFTDYLKENEKIIRDFVNQQSDKGNPTKNMVELFKNFLNLPEPEI